MKRLIALPLALALACGWLCAPAEAQKQEKEESDAQTLVYMGDKGPVAIRVHLRTDGVSHREAYRAFIDEMFDYLDLDRDGKLSRREFAAAPQPGVLASQGFGGAVGADLDADRDGVVTRREFREFYRRNGLTPFQISASGPQRAGFRVLRLDGPRDQRPAAEALNARLVALLDRDKDGKLSKAELDDAPKLLSKFDRDEDETLSQGELMNQPPPTEDGDLQAVFLAESVSAVASDSRFALLAEGRTDRAMAARLLARYAKSAKKLDAKAFGLARLDRDEDGWLDEEELSRLGDASADVELIVRLGKREGKEPFVEVVKKGRSLRKLETTKEGVVATIENARVVLSGPEPQPKTNFRIDFVDQYKIQFNAADADSNGYLDKAEAGKNPVFRDVFAAMDRDGDGMLYEKEVIAYLDQMAKFRQAAVKGCASLTVRDDGKGLFDHADADGDGRLSVRELRGMAKALLRLDTDDDGKLALAEVPRSYRGAFEQGASGVRSGGVAFVTVLGGPMEAPPPAAKARGPLWFTKMDRNRDGDVSRKEWLGTKEAFDEIDADKDDLIGPAEAEAYDRARRKG